MSTPRIAVIGAGAAGTLVAAQLTAGAARSGTRCDIVMVDPRPGTGRGTAYSTTDRRHRLNVPAAGMSAWPEDAGHFLRWLRTHVDPAATGYDFAARADYGRYLADVLDDALSAAHGLVSLERLHERASGLRRYGTRLRLRVGSVRALAVDAAVLATGNAAPDTGWAPEQLLRSGALVADPWAPGALAELADLPGDVLLVGSGLTMVDVALSLSRPDRVLHAVSRHGLLPRTHGATGGRVPLPPPVVAAEGRLALTDLRRTVAQHLSEGTTAHGDWRPAFDSLRPVTSAWWQRMSTADQARFLREDARRWDVHRHRTAPQIGAEVRELLDGGRLVTHTGTVAGATSSGQHVQVTLSDGTTHAVAAVVACTGPAADVRRLADPLLLDLLTRGTARPGPHAMGLDTDEAGRVRAANGDPLRAVYAIGPLRRGRLWESTAVPEIRTQAADVAHHVLAGLPPAQLTRRPRDSYGLPLSTSPAAAEAYTEAITSVLLVRGGAEDDLRRAVAQDPEFALGHAALALLGDEWGAPVDVATELAAAQRFARRWGDERERSFVAAVTERITRPGPAAVSDLLAHIHSFPEDALAVSLAVPTIAFSGATELPAEAWALVEGLAPTYGTDWWYDGMLAFIRQEQRRFGEAEQLAERALAVQPGSGHAVHARTHVFYETADHEAGLQFLDGWVAGAGRAAAHRAHYSWHAALHELALGDDEAVRRRYAGQLAPDQVTGTRALVDSASLLWRCELTRRWDGAVPIGDVLAVVDDELLDRPTTPFAGMHCAVALAAAEDAERLRALARHCARSQHPVLQETVAALATALAELVDGRAGSATDQLLRLRGTERLGGSDAQREVIEDTLLAASMAAGRTDVTRAVLDRRLDRRPSRNDSALMLSLR